MARLRSAVRTLRYTFAYDNFDINFKVSQATVEKSSLFVSATSAIALPLYDGGPLNLNLEAMRCSAELWDRSDTNPFPVLPLPESHELQDTLCELRNESDNFSEDEVSLTPHEKRMAWQKPDGVCFNDPPL